MPPLRYSAGTELDLLLGTTRPWIVALGQVLPIGVLLMLFVGLGVYAEFDMSVMMHSLALIVLGSIVCTYLGLLITRGLGWFETIAGILTMAALTLAALAVVRDDFGAAIGLEVLLVGLAIVYRFMARSRWLALDWMRCRFETPARGAG
ncbi:MAG TPA: hypothetical protein VMR74_14020 [Gammaproteobacteria bacterium]|nr:hypothetical protein [Gammaproteobacteria bacterium]